MLGDIGLGHFEPITGHLKGKYIMRQRAVTVLSRIVEKRRALWHRFGNRPAFRSQWLAIERGSVTAEYVIATLAAVSFAGLLVVILRGDEVRQILTEMVRSALSFGG